MTEEIKRFATSGNPCFLSSSSAVAVLLYCCVPRARIVAPDTSGEGEHIRSAETMGAEKEIVNAPALAAGVEVLRTGLTSFESSTRQMKSIFEDFEGRLGKLEGEMLPMKDISAKLTTSRRNIINAISKVTS